MLRHQYHRPPALGGAACALALVLAACGGGGASSGGGPVIMGPGPSPSPSPSPSGTPTPSSSGATDRIIGSVSTSQTFAAEGRYPLTDGGLTVSYEASTGHYLVTYPGNTTPQPLVRDPSVSGQDPWSSFVVADNNVFVLTRASFASANPTTKYMYSNLATWGFRQSTGGGSTAFGIATPQAGVPLTGKVTYTGFLEGITTEKYRSDGADYNASLKGTVTVTFDFDAKSAEISYSPQLGLADYRPLAPVDRLSLVYSTGIPAFYQSGQGLDYPISGRFTGPGAEELIGGLRFTYASPIDGSQQTAGGAFIAKRN
ncbi:hypothetical protein ACFO0A_00310 [Novosphingobium tardum]|uniref:Transferrin-binding protein B C-lobe/N-lobe beta barrel domain-containing protein n=1 Tax=Novosphingobium tardum TaxID=1538021 RepID=A0ABV8RL46_9SPHN